MGQGGGEGDGMSAIIAIVSGWHGFWQFLFLCFCVACASSLLAWPFRLVNRLLRHLNIRKAGWPPEYLDADGDRKEMVSDT
jgi:hypothetical protein